MLYLQNYKEFEAKILDLQLEKYGLSFDIKKYTTSGWALEDENVIGIRSFKIPFKKVFKKHFYLFWGMQLKGLEMGSLLPLVQQKWIDASKHPKVHIYNVD